MAVIDYLDFHDLLLICDEIIPGYQIRDKGLMLSAIERPQTLLYGVEVYPDFDSKAAALMHSLARNHALVDGNKRLAWSSMRIFCLMNKRDVNLTVSQAEKLTVAVAAGKFDVPEIARKLGIVKA
jgi:death-on-curing protein